MQENVESNESAALTARHTSRLVVYDKCYCQSKQESSVFLGPKALESTIVIGRHILMLL